GIPARRRHPHRHQRLADPEPLGLHHARENATRRPAREDHRGARGAATRDDADRRRTPPPPLRPRGLGTGSLAAQFDREAGSEERRGFAAALPSVWGVWGAISGPPTWENQLMR